MSTDTFKAEIKQFDFNNDNILKIRNINKGEDWPLVYILSGNKEAYVGETQNAYNRMKQHLSNSERRTLNKISLMMSESFNKSAILDIENMLITHMFADGKYKLQNANGGQSHLHNYYQRALYQNSFNNIWEDLRNIGLVDHHLFEVQNSDIFKYSPYKMLTTEQYAIVEGLLNNYVNSINNDYRTDILIKGGAGTGKTLIAIYFLNILLNIKNSKIDYTDIDINDDSIYNNLTLLETIKENHDLKIGFVVPVPSFKNTVKKIFKSIPDLKKVDIVSPFEAFKNTYDILVVDEAQRLKKNIKINNYLKHINNDSLNLPNETSELELFKRITKKMLILFYDDNQKIKESEGLISDKDFDNKTINYFLNAQLRVKGGNEYIDFVNKLFKENPISYTLTDGYDLKIYDDCKLMYEDIKKKNIEYKGLCRMLSGLSFDLKKKENDNSFLIDGVKYSWAKDFNATDFITDESNINRIGCVYTSQGHDLNYAGVIIGNDVKYNKETKKIEFDVDNFFDVSAKANNNEQTIKNIISVYLVLLTRGIYGTYIYAVDKNLREYLKSLIKINEKNN